MVNKMAYYIILFYSDKVINVIRYSEDEYEDYIKNVHKLKDTYVDFQHGYF